MTVACILWFCSWRVCVPIFTSLSSLVRPESETHRHRQTDYTSKYKNPQPPVGLMWIWKLIFTDRINTYTKAILMLLFESHVQKLHFLSHRSSKAGNTCKNSYLCAQKKIIPNSRRDLILGQFPITPYQFKCFSRNSCLTNFSKYAKNHRNFAKEGLHFSMDSTNPYKKLYKFFFLLFKISSVRNQLPWSIHTFSFSHNLTWLRHFKYQSGT